MPDNLGAGPTALTPSGTAEPSAGASCSAPRGARAGIVTTIKDFGVIADSWCAYHLAIGFEHLYIYFDDPRELDSVDLASRFPSHRVTCVPHTAALRDAWKRLPGSDTILRFVEAEGQTRQKLNASHALQLALARGLDWLLHIDGDELFYPGPSGDAATHFRDLHKAKVATFCYINHEAVPETHGIVDPFREVTLFKRSLELVTPTNEAQSAVAFWQQRQEGCFFYYYDNGKAAVRVHRDARPLSVHEWLPGRKSDMDHWYSNMREPWPTRGQLGSIVRYMPSEACILHYPCYNVTALETRWRRGNDNCAQTRPWLAPLAPRPPRLVP